MPPHLSKIMPPMFAAGLMLMPPVSKVIALPTINSGFCLDFFLPLGNPCSRQISRGGVPLPPPTASRPPMPSFFKSFSSITRQVRPASSARFSATFASDGGLMSLPGRLAIVRAKFWPNATASARAAASFARLSSVTTVSLTLPSASAVFCLAAGPRYSRKSKAPRQKPVTTASTAAAVVGSVVVESPSLPRAIAGGSTATWSSLYFLAWRASVAPAWRSASTFRPSPTPRISSRVPSTIRVATSPALPRKPPSPIRVSAAAAMSSGSAMSPSSLSSPAITTTAAAFEGSLA